MELQSAIETRFGISLNDADYQQVRTLGELKQLLGRPISDRARTEPASMDGAPRPQDRDTFEPFIQPENQPRVDPHIYPAWPWSLPACAVRFVFQEMIGRPLVWLLAKPRVARDLVAEPPEPLLIVANHVTAFDVPLILFALPRRMRNRVAVAMAAEMLLDWRKGRNQGNAFLNFVAPLQYWLVTGLFNVFPLPRAGNFRKSFAHAGRAMDHGYHVLVFPEGERTRDGQMHAFLGGSGILWKDLHTAALPVYLGGLAEIAVQQLRWFRSGRLSVRVGKEIQPPRTGDPSEFTRQLEKAVRALGEP